MSDIFLSYKSEDRPKAKIIAEALEQYGYSVWWDRTILPGRNFDEVIKDALNAAKCVIVLWSKKSVLSDWVKEEAENGKKRQILVPILIEDVEMPIGFGRIQAAQLVDWQGKLPNPEFDLLLKSVGEISGKPPVPKKEVEKTSVNESNQYPEKTSTIDGIKKPISHIEEEHLKPKINRLNITIGILAIVVVIVLYLRIYVPQLSVSPDTFDFGTMRVGDTKDVILNIYNDNKGSRTLEWWISYSDLPKWVVLNPVSGVNNGRVNIKVDTAGLDPGNHGLFFKVESTGGSRLISLNVNIEAPPKLGITLHDTNTPNPSDVNSGFERTIYAGQEGKVVFDISNAGGGILEWNIDIQQGSYLNPNWFTINQKAGTNSRMVIIQVSTVSTEGVTWNPGTYSAKIKITSNGGNLEIPLKTTVLRGQ